jgi:hypothetical protein
MVAPLSGAERALNPPKANRVKRSVPIVFTICGLSILAMRGS